MVKQYKKTILIASIFAVVAGSIVYLIAAAPIDPSLQISSTSSEGRVIEVDDETAAGGRAYQFLASTPPPDETDPPPTGTPASINGQLYVCDRTLCNQYGNPVQLRGMSTHGIQWYGWGSCINPDSLDALATDWQADVLRVSLYVQEGGYESNPTGFTAMADTIIDAAIARGLYVLIDWHQLSPGDPNANLASAQTYFTHMATRYKDVPNVIYEIANEPNNVSWQRIKEYAEFMIPHIRALDPDGIVIVGTHGWGSFGVSDGDWPSTIWDNPVNATNILYSFHFYAASHGQAYRDALSAGADRFPVFVTEWGSQASDGDQTNDFTSAQAFVDIMAQKNISWTSWNYSDDFRTGASFTTGTCPNGPFTEAGGRLKEAGSWLRQKIREPADSFSVD